MPVPFWVRFPAPEIVLEMIMLDEELKVMMPLLDTGPGPKEPVAAPEPIWRLPLLMVLPA